MKKWLKDNACAITVAGIWGITFNIIAREFGLLRVPFIIACLIGGWVAGSNLDEDIKYMKKLSVLNKKSEQVKKELAEIGGSPYESPK